VGPPGVRSVDKWASCDGTLRTPPGPEGSNGKQSLKVFIRGDQVRLIRRSQRGAPSVSDGAIRDLCRALSEECGVIRKWNKEPSFVPGVIRIRGGAISVGDGAIRIRCRASSADHGAIRGQHKGAK